MRRLCSFFAIVLSGLVSVQADDAATIAELTAAKAALDDAFQDQDVSAIESMVTSDHTSVTTYYGRVYTTADQIATMSEFDARFFDFSPDEVTLLGPDAALVTFENSYEGTFEGRPLPPRIYVSEIWRKQDGKWLQQRYQETPID